MHPKLPLLLLHGALAEKTQFSPLKPYLNEHFEIFDFDFDGHGEKAISQNGFSMDVFRSNILNYLEEVPFERVHLFGYSMGGYAALLAGLQAPERIASVFTLGTKLLWTEDGAKKEVKMLDADVMEAKIPAFVESLKKQHKATDWKDLICLTAKMMVDLGSNDRLSSETLQKIMCPVRLTCGDKDTTAPLEDTLKAFRTIPGAQLQVFPATAHPFERINHTLLAQSLISFCTEVYKKEMPSLRSAQVVSS